MNADVGTNGRVSDGGVWNKCSFPKKLSACDLPIPSPKPLNSFTCEHIPYLFVRDDVFALKLNLMKPYPQLGLTEDKRIYNYRHSWARRISENLFGIIVNRWRVFRSAILLPPASVKNIVFAILTLHNFLRRSQSKNIYCPQCLMDTEDSEGDVIEGSWRKTPSTGSMLPFPPLSSGNNPCNDAKKVRKALKDYFCFEGAVEWQWDKCKENIVKFCLHFEKLN